MSQVTVIPFAFPGIPNVCCAFQTRTGGVSTAPYRGGNIGDDVGDKPQSVEANLASLRKVLGVGRLAQARQVHGRDLVFDPDPDRPVECDGMATDKPDLGLMIKTADCQPVLLTDLDGRHIAALHVGWRGNRIKFIPLAVAAFCAKYGLFASQLCAVRGPSLGPARSEFVNFDTEWGRSFETWYDAVTQTVDLWRLTRDQLMIAGLRSNHVFGLDLCTASLPRLFFSYRNERVTGRQASVIWMRR